jgi:hypothetical protein
MILSQDTKIKLKSLELGDEPKGWRLKTRFEPSTGFVITAVLPDEEMDAWLRSNCNQPYSIVWDLGYLNGVPKIIFDSPDDETKFKLHFF